MAFSACRQAVRQISSVARNAIFRVDDLAVTSTIVQTKNAPSRFYSLSDLVDVDLVKDEARKHHAEYHAMLDELKKVDKVPLDPEDEIAVREWADKIASIREKVGVPSLFEQFDESALEIKDSASDMRTMLKDITLLRKELGIEDTENVETLFYKALDKVEQRIGRPMMKEDKDGTPLWDAEVKAIQERLGVMDDDLDEDTMYDTMHMALAKGEITEIRDAVKEAETAFKASKVLKSFGEFTLDLKSIKPQEYL